MVAIRHLRVAIILKCGSLGVFRQNSPHLFAKNKLIMFSMRFGWNSTNIFLFPWVPSTNISAAHKSQFCFWFLHSATEQTISTFYFWTGWTQHRAGSLRGKSWIWFHKMKPGWLGKTIFFQNGSTIALITSALQKIAIAINNPTLYKDTLDSVWMWSSREFRF